jgi:hypothetical protein
VAIVIAVENANFALIAFHTENAQNATIVANAASV